MLVRPGLVLAAALAGTVLLGWLLGLAVESVSVQGQFFVDAPVAEELAERHSPAMTRAMKVVTWFGNRGVVLAAMALVSAALLVVAKNAGAALFLASSVVGGNAVSHLVKDLVHRVRPVEGLVPASGGSFPSGHAVSSVTLYAGIAFLAAVLSRSRRVRWAGWAGALLLIASIASSRVYLGVHWTSDVIAGVLLGATWVVACAAAWSKWVRSGGSSAA